jgi:hypothetical protein
MSPRLEDERQLYYAKSRGVNEENDEGYGDATLRILAMFDSPIGMISGAFSKPRANHGRADSAFQILMSSK